MLEEILYLLQRRPFVPFVVMTTGGQAYPVPTVDHASLNPARNVLTIYGDGRQWAVVYPEHVDSIHSFDPSQPASLV